MDKYTPSGIPIIQLEPLNLESEESWGHVLEKIQLARRANGILDFQWPEIEGCFPIFIEYFDGRFRPYIKVAWHKVRYSGETLTDLLVDIGRIGPERTLYRLKNYKKKLRRTVTELSHIVARLIILEKDQEGTPCAPKSADAERENARIEKLLESPLIAQIFEAYSEGGSFVAMRKDASGRKVFEIEADEISDDHTMVYVDFYLTNGQRIRSELNVTGKARITKRH